jgi:hypothetical protein
MRMTRLLVFAALLFTTVSIHAQTTNNRNPQTTNQTPRLAGRILDPSGAVIPGADIKVFQGRTLVKDAKSDERGAFAMELPAAEYRIEVTAAEFKPFQGNLRVVPNMQAVSIPMVLATVSTQVDVGSKKDEVTIDEDANLTSTTISGDAVKDLPEDEDALMQQLQAIAGGSGAAGANATFVIDGISGGRVPPRDQIQQIIIDTNVFSAEGVGGPRIQIITKPGTGPWSGNLNLGFNDESLNAKNPFLSFKPSNQQRTFNTNYGGPVIPGKLTMRFNARESKIEFEGSATHAITDKGPVTAALVSPQVNRGLTINGQLFLTTNNTLNFGLNYGENRMRNQGVTDITLPERAFNSNIDNTNVNLSTRSIIGTRYIYETRFAFGRQINLTNPQTDAIQINVLGWFNGGGAQNKRDDKRKNWSLGQTLRWTVSPKINVVTGMDAFYNQVHSASETNYLGAFTFSNLDDYIAGRPIQFRKISGNPVIDVNQLELAVFLQTDLRLNSKTNVGVGLRYQAQTNFSDRNNLAPTVQLAYQLTPKTVIRTGGRLTYQPFSMNNVEQLLRFDGTTRQFETVILNPSYPDPFLNSAGTTSGVSTGSIRVRDPNLKAPSNINSAITVEQTLPKSWRFATSFDLTRGLNLIRTRNINAPYPGTPLSEDLISRLNSRNSAVQAAARSEVDRMRPYYPLIGNINQFESTGRSTSKNLGLRLFTPGNLSLFKLGFNGFIQYTLGSSKDNLSAMNQYDFNSDWGYTGFDTRHRVFGNLTVRLPKTSNLSFFVMANSGNPYNVTTGRDENGDQSTSDRPVGYARNSERGPGRYNVDMNFTKQFVLKKAEQPRTAGISFGEPQIVVMGPGGGGPIMMPPPPGAPGGPGQGGLRMSFNVNAANLFNNTQLRNYSGVITSPFFRQSNTAMDGRRIRLGVGFTF